MKFYVSSRQSNILHFDWLLLFKLCTVSTKKNTEKLSLMTLKSDLKFKEKLLKKFKKKTCSFKHDMRNLVNFHPTTQNFENLILAGFFVQIIKVWDKQIQKSYLSWHWVCKIGWTQMQNLRSKSRNGLLDLMRWI